MLHLRCPHHGCSIDVADDQIGEWIHCPKCRQLLIVDPQHQENAGTQIQPETPALALEPAPKRGSGKPTHGEDRVHAGLPPLAVMLGVRKGRGKNWHDESEVRAHMTGADWQAFAAFEKVVSACTALKTALIGGMAVALITALLWWAAARVAIDESSFVTKRWGGWLATLALLTAGFVLMAGGSRRLERLRMGTLVELAAWAAAAVAFMFLVLAARNLQSLWDHSSDPTPPAFALLAIPFQLIEAYAAGRASLWIHHARQQVSPPELLRLLTEALACLQAAGD